LQQKEKYKFHMSIWDRTLALVDGFDNIKEKYKTAEIKRQSV
jgi:hypothetical protein